MTSLDRVRRTCATWACFATFMGASATALPLVPLFFLLPSRSRKRAGKVVTGGFFRLFTALMRGLGVLDLEIRDPAALERDGLFIVANHPTLIDFVVLASVVPRADCLVKSALLDHWAMRWPVSLAGYIANDRGEETVELCRESLNAGNSVVLFPEGTRTPPGASPDFRKGAAQLALRCGRPVTPVVIRCADSNLHKGGPWYVVPLKKPRMVLIPLKAEDSVETLRRHGGQYHPAARALNALLERRIQEVLERD